MSILLVITVATAILMLTIDILPKYYDAFDLRGSLSVLKLVAAEGDSCPK